jgi:hypothetical protein
VPLNETETKSENAGFCRSDFKLETLPQLAKGIEEEFSHVPLLIALT